MSSISPFEQLFPINTCACIMPIFKPGVINSHKTAADSSILLKMADFRHNLMHSFSIRVKYHACLASKLTTINTGRDLPIAIIQSNSHSNPNTRTRRHCPAEPVHTPNKARSKSCFLAKSLQSHSKHCTGF